MTTGDETSSESKPTERTPAGWHKYWQTQMDAADKRMRNFIRKGTMINGRYLDDRYDGQDAQDIEFRLNLFHANVKTQLDMMYGRTPKTDVSREFADPDDDLSRVAALILERMLQKSHNDVCEDLGSVLQMCLQDRLLPGVGTARVRYEAKFKVVMVEGIDPETGEIVMVEEEVLDYEKCHTEYVFWQDYRWGWSRTYKDLPWQAYRSWMDEDQARERFGSKIAKNLEYKNQLVSGNDGEGKTEGDEKKNNVQQAEIWEIWNKKDRKVYWFSPGAELILDIEDDPLGLKSFWCSPKPLMANCTTTQFMPKSDFTLAQDLYNEVDCLQTRIAHLTKAVKLVGVYDKSADGLKRMLNEGLEGEMIPVDNWAMFAEKGGVKGAVDWFPVQEVVEVLVRLKEMQDSSIALLYQLTGMSDILRGHSDRYSGVGQEQLKAKFGSIRIQRLQDEFAKFASSLDNLKAEVISNHYSVDTIATYSNAEFLPRADQPTVPAAIDLIKSPEIMWKVDIKPESLAMVDYAQLKAERIEFITAMATYVQSMGAMVQSQPGALPFLLEILKWTMAGFKGADYMEGMFDQAIDAAMQQQEQPNQQQQAEQQREQMAQQFEMMKIRAKFEADMQLQQQRHQQDMERMSTDHEMKMQQMITKMQGDLERIMADLRADLQLIATNSDADQLQEMSQAENAVIEGEVEHENTMIEMEQQHENTMEEIAAQQAARQSNTEGE